jgi:DNA repair exonuclease SbcCD ATPase subunit
MAEKPDNIPTPADFLGWVNQMMALPMKAMTDVLPQGTGNNPLEFWQGVNQRNEEMFSRFLQQFVGTPDFAKNLGQTANASAMYRNAIKQTARFYLEAADMPTREDVARLGEMLINIEGKLEELNESVVNLEDELDETEDSLEALSKTLAKNQEAQDMELKGLKAAIEAPAKEQAQLGKVVSLLENIGERLGKIEGRLDKLETAKAAPAAKAEPRPKTTSPKTPRPGVSKVASEE